MKGEILHIVALTIKQDGRFRSRRYHISSARYGDYFARVVDNL